MVQGFKGLRALFLKMADAARRTMPEASTAMGHRQDSSREVWPGMCWTMGFGGLATGLADSGMGLGFRV